MTVVVGTFGGHEWVQLAEQRAIPSARALGVQVVHAHAETLHEARNQGLDQVETDWVVHLDADDELQAGYLDAMAGGTADVRAPAVQYVDKYGRATPPRMPHVAGHERHDCTADCLAVGNWLVVGALVRADMVRKVGGWRDFAWSEDWDLWLRCHLAGASFEPVPSAVYRAHVRRDSRNRAPSHAAKMDAHRAICAANGIPGPA